MSLHLRGVWCLGSKLKLECILNKKKCVKSHMNGYFIKCVLQLQNTVGLNLKK